MASIKDRVKKAMTEGYSRHRVQNSASAARQFGTAAAQAGAIQKTSDFKAGSRAKAMGIRARIAGKRALQLKKEMNKKHAKKKSTRGR